jgi:hypothetical protein
MIKLSLPKETLEKLQHLAGSGALEFLGFTFDLETGVLSDKLLAGSMMKNFTEWHLQLLATLLSHYASANPTPSTGKLVKYRDIPGGYAYEDAFIKRAIQPVEDFFGETPEELAKAAKLLGGTQLGLGDASVEIAALKGIPLTYILWSSNEFPASANILYDESASNYLPTEDLAVLGELTTGRLIEAKAKNCGK